MEQTAVEWLFLMLNNPNTNQEFAHKLLEKAKAMEKEQLKNAYTLGRTGGTIKDFNETFKSE